MKTYITIIVLLFAMANGWCQTSLEEYVEFAINNNPGLKSSYAEFEASMQKIQQVSSLEDPNLRISTFGQMVETRTGQQMARFSLEQMFPWFGTLKEQKNAAALNAEVAYESFKNKRNELILNVKMGYYPLYEVDESIRINEENLKILETFKALAVSKFQHGEGNMSDALRVDIMTNEIKSDIAVLKEKRKTLLLAFNKLLNRDEQAEVVVQNLPEIMVPVWSRDSLTHNPGLVELRKKVLAAQVQERLAEKQAAPKLGLGLEYIITQKRPEMDFSDNGKDAYMAMFSVSLPIYRKKYHAAIKETQLMQTSFTLQQQQVENNLIAEYEAVMFEIARAQEQITLYNKQTAQTKQIISLLTTAVSNNEADFEEILELQQVLLKYELMEITARKEYAEALANIEFLVAH